MKRKATRWYMLWFFTAGMWLITFCGNLSSGMTSDWIVVLQLVNSVLCLAAGIINARRYKREQNEEEKGREREL